MNPQPSDVVPEFFVPYRLEPLTEPLFIRTGREKQLMTQLKAINQKREWLLNLEERKLRALASQNDVENWATDAPLTLIGKLLEIKELEHEKC